MRQNVHHNSLGNVGPVKARSERESLVITERFLDTVSDIESHPLTDFDETRIHDLIIAFPIRQYTLNTGSYFHSAEKG